MFPECSPSAGAPCVSRFTRVWELQPKQNASEIFFTFLFTVCVFSPCMHVCTPCSCLMPRETERRFQILWKWSYRLVDAILWVPSIEPGTLERAARVLDHLTLESQAPDTLLLLLVVGVCSKKMTPDWNTLNSGCLKPFLYMDIVKETHPVTIMPVFLQWPIRYFWNCFDRQWRALTGLSRTDMAPAGLPFRLPSLSLNC